MNRILRFSVRFLAAVVVALLAAGCVADNSYSPQIEAAQTFTSSISSTINPGDVLGVTIIGENDLSGSYTVAPQGTLELPLVGAVAVVGLGTESAAKAIAAEYRKGYLVSPDVKVEKRPAPAVFVMGAVAAAGSYPYGGQTTVMKAASLAGGFKEYANLMEFDVVRDGHLLKADAATPVKAGDVIMVKGRKP